MILPPEKTQGESRESDAFSSISDSRSRATAPPGPPPTFPAGKAPTPPLIRLQYHPESSSSSHAILPPNFPTPFDNNAPPPSYSDRFVSSASSSRLAPTSSTTNAAMYVPMAPGGGTPSFARPVSREVTYPSFQPMFLVATGRSLAKGFPYTSPPSNSIPHPFASHDVYEVDWMSFLEEARMVAALTHKQIEVSEHLPILSRLPIVKDLASYGVKQLMKHQNAPKVINCIDKWNRHFFEQRKMRIILMKGSVRVSGQNEYQNDIQVPPTSSSSKLESEYQNYHDDHPLPSNPSVSQALTGENDDVYRLFIVPLS